MIVIPKVQATLLEGHEGRIGVGGTGLEVRAAAIAISDDRPVGRTVTGEPVVTVLVGVDELVVLRRGDRDSNLLHSDFNLAGVGVASDNQRTYFTLIFLG
jgi:hypothetical protein